MEPIVAVMLILGCDHSMMVCRQSAAPVRQYASVEACETDMSQRIHEIEGYPMAIAECVRVPGIAPDREIAIDWRLDAVGGLIANVSVAPEGAVVVADAGQ